ncbi:D-2-hydroxyacid dehydrogenase [Cardiobacteriaceae bacterium TAE3-ERU3]|nr:D-2-hydroxyacid dehydrogenase [Cardiobacteriaceae bacterium TAE3-ERU3]
MRAVFLDAATFSPDVDLPKPEKVSEWTVHDNTEYETATIVARLKDADIAVLNKVPIGEAELSQLPNLKLIQVTATGTDIVDKQACEQHGVAVQNVAGYSTDSVAEHTWMFILAAMRGLPRYAKQAVDGSWQDDGRFCLNALPIIELKGKTLGIIGTGEIGNRVAEIARVFGVNVLFAERKGREPRNGDYTAFEQVLAESDVLTLHCPLTDDTHHLINKETLALMKRKPLLVNLARGAVVDDAAVADALENGTLRGFASDVFSPEPPARDNPLYAHADHPRVICTPHNAWSSMEAQARLWDQLCGFVNDFIEKKDAS